MTSPNTDVTNGRHSYFYITLIVLIIGVCFIIWLWANAWHYDHDYGMPIRTNRFTGRTQRFIGTRWQNVLVPQSSPSKIADEPPSSESGAGDVKQLITARQFDLVDESGKVRASLGISSQNEPHLLLLGNGNNVKLAVEIIKWDNHSKPMPSITLYNDEQQLLSALTLKDDVSSLTLINPNTSQAVALAAAPNQSSLSFQNQQYISRTLGLVTYNGKATLGIKDEKGKLVWSP